MKIYYTYLSLLLAGLPAMASLRASVTPPAPSPAKTAPAGTKPAAEPAPPPAYDQNAERRKAVMKSIALLQKSATIFSKASGPTCLSCHHSLLPIMTLAVAREHDLPVDEAGARAQRKILDAMLAEVGPLLAKAQTDPATDQGLDSGDMPFMFGYILAGFAAEKRARDASTDAMARYLLRKQLPDGSYPAHGTRAPLEGNAFTATALAVQALQSFAPKSEKEAAVRGIGRARTWLIANTPRTNEDRAFRLLGLKWAEADPAEIRRAAEDLRTAQNDDGGWSQLPYQLLSSDAYATGQALVALHQGGGLSTGEVVYQRGVNFLVNSQRPDGAWLVSKRCHPVVPYFDAGFPGGKDQFVSFAGSCWADMAIALTLPTRANPHVAATNSPR